MDSSRCYICRRTVKEIESFLDVSSDFRDNARMSSDRKAAEKSRELAEIDSAVARRDFEYLRTRGMEGLLASKPFLDEFGDWNSSKIDFARRHDYPLKDSDLNLLDQLLNRRSSAFNPKASDTVTDVRRASEERYEALRKEASPYDVGRLFRVEIRGVKVYDVAAEPSRQYGMRGQSRSFSVSVPVCSVCERIMKGIGKTESVSYPPDMHA
ncbi:MAG: hypothetical protein IKP20_05390 [Candidatus Methanomethylophilaceae archaeon]|nr:hypothetical protein [Candidatus Methanomethylophilaceae archaeon]